MVHQNDTNDAEKIEERDAIKQTWKHQGIEGRLTLFQMEKEWEKEDKPKSKSDGKDGKDALSKCVHVPSAKPSDALKKPWNVTSVEEKKGVDPPFYDKMMRENWTQQMLFRIYPHGLRFDSSNYNPLSFWGAGCQLVALNYHTDGFPMWLNEGKFMRAGRSGWIQKPKHLRKNINPDSKENEKKEIDGNDEKNKEEGKNEGKNEGKKGKNKGKKGKGKEKEEKNEGTTGTDENNEDNDTILEVTVISGWRLPRPWGTKTLYSKSPPKPCKPRVEVSLWTPKSVIAFQTSKTNVKTVDTEIVQHVQVYYTAKSNDNPHNPIFCDPHKYDRQTDNAKSHPKENAKKQKNLGYCRTAPADEQPFKFVVEDKELDMLVFKVFDNSDDDTILGFRINADANRVIGYYAITVDDLREGIRVVPLKGELGAPLLHGDLMVKINLKSTAKEKNNLSSQISKTNHKYQVLIHKFMQSQVL